MKVILPICVILFNLFCAGMTQKSPGIFLTKYKVDVDNVIASKRLLISYSNCLLDKGPCTLEARELKSKYKSSKFIVLIYVNNFADDLSHIIYTYA